MDGESRDAQSEAARFFRDSMLAAVAEGAGRRRSSILALGSQMEMGIARVRDDRCKRLGLGNGDVRGER